MVEPVRAFSSLASASLISCRCCCCCFFGGYRVVAIWKRILQSLTILTWRSAELSNKLQMAHNVHSGGQALCFFLFVFFLGTQLLKSVTFPPPYAITTQLHLSLLFVLFPSFYAASSSAVLFIVSCAQNLVTHRKAPRVDCRPLMMMMMRRRTRGTASVF